MELLEGYTFFYRVVFMPCHFLYDVRVTVAAHTQVWRNEAVGVQFGILYEDVCVVPVYRIVTLYIHSTFVVQRDPIGESLQKVG